MRISKDFSSVTFIFLLQTWQQEPTDEIDSCLKCDTWMEYKKMYKLRLHLASRKDIITCVLYLCHTLTSILVLVVIIVKTFWYLWCSLYVYINIFLYSCFLTVFFYTQQFDIKYSHLKQIICKQQYIFKYSAWILIYTQLYDSK